MTWPAPTRADHEKFCKREGWKRVRNAKGKTGTHHLTYELTLPNGRILRTRISHPPGKQTYGPAMWKHILSDQLDVNEKTFWACVHKGKLPPRQPAAPHDAIPADIIHLLKTRVGLPDNQIALLSKQQAVEKLTTHWTTGK